MSKYWNQTSPNQDKLQRLEAELVPIRGMCELTKDEGLRLCSRLIYDWGNNGMGNWEGSVVPGAMEHWLVMRGDYQGQEIFRVIKHCMSVGMEYGNRGATLKKVGQELDKLMDRILEAYE